MMDVIGSSGTQSGAVVRGIMESKLALELFEDAKKSDEAYATWSEHIDALASFVTDYEFLQGKNKFTQQDIARKIGTTQSAISRMVNLKGKPNYDLLQRVSAAVGGELLVTPLGKYSVTLPYDLIDVVDMVAKRKNIGVSELLLDIVRSYFDA